MKNKEDMRRELGLGQAVNKNKLPPLQDFKVTRNFPTKSAPTTPELIDHDDDCDSTD